MMMFSEYFGYRSSNWPHRRNLRRTEVSTQKMGESLDLKKIHRRSNPNITSHLPAKRLTLETSPARTSRKTLKSSPFKIVGHRRYVTEQKMVTSGTREKITEKNRHIIERFNKEDFSTKKEKVDKEMIISFSQRHQQELLNKKNQFVDPYPNNRISSPVTHKKKQTSGYPRQQSRKSKEQTITSHRSKNKQQIVQKKRSQAKLTPTKKIESEIQVPNSPGDYYSNEQAKDCFINPKFSDEDDEYQIKHRVSNKILDEGIPKLKKIESFGESQNSLNNFGLTESVDTRAKNHYEELQKFLRFVNDLNESNKSISNNVMRKVYFCRRMYYKELCKMKQCLQGKTGVKNCFILSSCEIHDQELKQHCSIMTQNLSFHIRQLESEIFAMKQSLEQESQDLLANDPNDPYIHFDNSNIETELVNEVYEQIVNISENIGQAGTFQRDKMQKRRVNAMWLIVLVGELCGYRKQTSRFVKEGSDASVFETNQEKLEEIIEKIQQMPL